MAFVSLMQGVEYLLWMNQDCNEVHRWTSVVGMWLNHLQPLVLGGLVLLFSTRRDYFGYVIAIMLLYAAVIIPYSLQYTDKGMLRCSVKRIGDPHLLWKWNVQPYYDPVYAIFLISCVLIALLGMPTVGQGIGFSIVTVLSFGISKYLFYDRETVGSLWCFFVVFLPLLYYGVRLLPLPLRLRV